MTLSTGSEINTFADAIEVKSVEWINGGCACIPLSIELLGSTPEQFNLHFHNHLTYPGVDGGRHYAEVHPKIFDLLVKDGESPDSLFMYSPCDESASTE